MALTGDARPRVREQLGHVASSSRRQRSRACSHCWRSGVAEDRAEERVEYWVGHSQVERAAVVLADLIV